MTKKMTIYDDEIELIELIKFFISHKIKFIILGIIGLCFGLGYTFWHESRFETEFKIHIGHPAFSSSLLINSSSVQEILNISELNIDIIPRYKRNKKTEIFSVTTFTDDPSTFVTKMLTDALNQELFKLKNIATSFEGFDSKPVILNYNNNLTWTNQDIAKLDQNEVIQSLKVSFGKSKVLYPKPMKHMD